MKNRLTLLDLVALVRDLRTSLVGARISNVYECVRTSGGRTQTPTLTLRATRPGARTWIVLDPGSRVHTSAYTRAHAHSVVPPPFLTALRRNVRGWRCTNVTLLGVDRTLDIQFGRVHLIVEMYDKGNVLLCVEEPGGGEDAEKEGGAHTRTHTYARGAAPSSRDAPTDDEIPAEGIPLRIIAAMRSYTLPGEDGDVRVAARTLYHTHTHTHAARTAFTGPAQLLLCLPSGAVRLTPVSGGDEAADDVETARIARELSEWLCVCVQGQDVAKLPTRQRKRYTIAMCLLGRGGGLDAFGAPLIEHAVVRAGLDPESLVTTLQAQTGAGAVKGKGAASDAAVSKGKGGAKSAEAAPAASPPQWDMSVLSHIARELRRLPQLLCDVANAATPDAKRAYAVVAMKKSAANSAAAVADAVSSFTTALTATAGGDDATDAPVLAADAHGRVGTWAEVQRKLLQQRNAALGVAGAPPSEPATPAATPVPDSAPAAASGDGDGVDDAEDDTPTVSQAPPDLPFDMVDFTPVLLAQYEAAFEAGELQYVEFPTCDALCDEYFSRLDMMRAARNEAAARSAAEKKVERLREGHKEAVAALQNKYSDAYHKARLIEAHAAEVDAACAIVRSALDNSLDWMEFARLVDAQAALGNPIAKLIVGLKLAHAKVRLALRDEDAAAEAAAARRAARGDDSDTDSSDMEDGNEGGVAATKQTRGRRGKAPARKLADATDDESGLESGVEAPDATEPDTVAAAETATSAATSAGGKGPRIKPASSKAQLKALAKAKSNKAVQERKAKAAPGTAPAGDVAIPERADVDEFTAIVELDVFETAASNARRYYEEGKAARSKSEKTAAMAEDAVSRAEKQVAAAMAKQIAEASAARAIHAARKPAWFEKFHWFITSEGLIVVAGKNAQDNEALVKRYLRPQDAYVHADVHGAASCVLRNLSNDPGAGGTIPPLSLEQAGAFCVCLSSAWSAHTPTSAWWVHAAQVSKTAPTGEYLGTGSFMIRGRKNMLPPVKLELGYVLLWKIDASCVEKHLKDRYVRGSLIDTDGPAVPTTSSSRPVERARPIAVEAPVAAVAVATTTEPAVAPPAAEPAPSPEEVNATTAASIDDDAGVLVSAEPETAGDGQDDDESGSDEAGDEASGAASADEGDDDHADDDGEHDAAEAENDAADAAPVDTTGTEPPSLSTPAALPGGPVPAHIRRRAKRLQELHKIDAPTALRRALEEAALKPVEDAPAASAAAAASKSTSAPVPAAAPATKRGQHGKRKKAKEKYADQDEEDRRLAAAAIGHEFTAPAPVDKKGKSATAGRSEAGASDGGKGRAGRGDAKSGSKSENKREPRVAVADRADAEEGESDAAADTLVAASLVASPLAEDIITHAVPMLCPYAVATSHPYKVKLMPGSMKKGKAARAAADAFLQHAQALSAAAGRRSGAHTAAPAASMHTRERELIRALAEAELVATMPSNVKVVH